MKKIIALLLVVGMCLSLCACASEEDKAFEAACALMDAGDYEGAITAFSAIGRYQEINSKIEEAQHKLDEQNVGFLLGTWKNLRTDFSITFQESGKAVNQNNSAITYSYENGIVKITQPTGFDLEVKDVDGITHLVSEKYDFVSEANYEIVGPKSVEITMDNWQEYFELREAKDIQTNEFGDITSLSFGYGVFLRDEVADRLIDMPNAIDVSFKLLYDNYYTEYFGDFPGGEYTLGETFLNKDWLGETDEVVASVHKVSHKDSESSDFYNVYAAKLVTGGRISGRQNGVSTPQNGKIISAIGTMFLLP